MYFKGSEECVAPAPWAMHSRPPQSWWLTGLHVSKATIEGEGWGVGKMMTGRWDYFNPEKSLLFACDRGSQLFVPHADVCQFHLNSSLRPGSFLFPSHQIKSVASCSQLCFWLLSSHRSLPQRLVDPDLRSLGNRAVHLMWKQAESRPTGRDWGV